MPLEYARWETETLSLWLWRTAVADPEHVAIVQAGKKAVDEWREQKRERRDGREGFDLSDEPLPINMAGLDLRHSDFANATLGATDLRGANLAESNFAGATMWLADLEGADLTDVKGLALSENNIRNARFSPNADDDWSVLRRTYTGARLLFHVLLMLAFFLPFVAKTFYWVALNNAQNHAMTLYSDVAKAVITHPELESVFHRVEADLKQRNELLKQRNELRQYAVWQLLLGVDRGLPTALLTIALLVYNLCRLILTRLVGPLREEEERSGITPKRGGWFSATRMRFPWIPDVRGSFYWFKHEVREYRWLMSLHYITVSLGAVAAISFLWNAWHWLTPSIWVQS